MAKKLPLENWITWNLNHVFYDGKLSKDKILSQPVNQG